MPLYEYYCPKCKEVYEMMIPISTRTEVQYCPKHKDMAMVRLMSLPNWFSKDSWPGSNCDQREAREILEKCED